MNIERLRKLKNLTQEDLAEMTGITQPTLSRAEVGHSGAKLGTYRAIANALSVPLAELFADDRTAIEAELLAAFRQLPRDRQLGWLDAAGRAAQASPQIPESSASADRSLTG